MPIRLMILLKSSYSKHGNFVGKGGHKGNHLEINAQVFEKSLGGLDDIIIKVLQDGNIIRKTNSNPMRTESFTKAKKYVMTYILFASGMKLKLFEKPPKFKNNKLTFNPTRKTFSNK